MTLVFIDFVGFWPGFDSSQNSVGLRGSDDPEGVTAPQVFQVMMKFLFFVCFCLQIFDECLSHIKSCTDIQLKAYLFLCRSQMSLKEIKWCQHDPDSVDWNGDYTDALFMHFEKYIFLWKKKSYFSCFIKL